MTVSFETPCDELLRVVNFPGEDYFINPVANIKPEDIGQEEDRKRVQTMLAGRTMKQLTIGELASIDGNWNKPSILEGMKLFYEIAQRENFYHDIYKGTDLEGKTALMAAVVPGKKQFAVICAGGGYGGCATMIEAFPLAKRLYDLGISSFILHYRVSKEAHYPNPMDDLGNAVHYILENSERLDVCIENYAVMGFSSGGHLAATFGCESIGWKHYGVQKPGCIILGYPVISLCEKKSSGTAAVLLAEDKDDIEKQMLYSVEKQATHEYPPTFMWQCTGDRSVPIYHTRMFNQMLNCYEVPHVFEEFDAVAHS